MIRRAAFLAWGVKDGTQYKYGNLGKDDEEHAGFDDVRSAAMGVSLLQSEGIDSVIGASLTSPLIGDPTQYKNVAERGLTEVGKFLDGQGVK